MRYTEGFKKSTVRRLLHPSSPGITQIAKETGAAVATLYNWMRKYREMIELADYKKTPDEWTLAEKHDGLLESAGMTPEEQGEWLRRKGLHSSHLTLWNKEVRDALAGAETPVSQAEQREARDRIRELEKELQRKDKALSEMTALVVLKKKLERIFSDEEQ